jgi:high-affinity Fe2+/Pb2+ permease
VHAFAAISALAAVVLTWMIFWMRRQSRLITGDLEHRVDSAPAPAPASAPRPAVTPTP